MDRKAWLRLICLIVLAVGCQLFVIGRDFNGLHEYDAAQTSLGSRNFLEFGPLKLAPVINVNPLTDKLTYYLYHPYYLPTYIYAGFFKLFGASELTARLTSMLIFYLGAISLSLLIAQVWSQKIAIFTLFFYLFFPVSQYYGKMASPLTIVVPLMFLFLLSYYLWQPRQLLATQQLLGTQQLLASRSHRSVYLSLLLATLFLVCLTEWFGYFLGLLAIIHFRYLTKNPDQRIFWIIPVCAVALAATLIITYAATGAFWPAQPQWPLQLGSLTQPGAENQNLFSHVFMTRMNFTLLLQASFYSTLFSHFLLAYSWPVLALSLFFLFNYPKGQAAFASKSFIFFLPLIYLGYGLPQPKTLSDHIFWTFLLAGSFALICAIVVARASRFWQVCLIAAFLFFSFNNTRQLYSLNNTNQASLILGKTLAAVTLPGDGLAVSEPFYDPLLEYYANRKILYDVDSREKLDYIIKHEKIKYFATSWPDFQTSLQGHYPSIKLAYNYLLFTLKP